MLMLPGVLSGLGAAILAARPALATTRTCTGRAQIRRNQSVYNPALRWDNLLITGSLGGRRRMVFWL